MSDELSRRRIAQTGRKFADLKLGAQMAVGLMPHAKWIAENPEADAIECPEHLLEVSIVLLGVEIHPSALEPDQAKWPRVAVPVHEFVRIPWPEWRRQMDEKFLPRSEADG